MEISHTLSYSVKNGSQRTEKIDWGCQSHIPRQTASHSISTSTKYTVRKVTHVTRK